MVIYNRRFLENIKKYSYFVNIFRVQVIKLSILLDPKDNKNSSKYNFSCFAKTIKAPN